MRSYKPLTIAVVALVAIALIGFAISRNNDNGSTATSGHNSHMADTPAPTASPSAAARLAEQYQGYKGEEYDRRFTAEMILHHEGAIQMAEQVQASTERPELRELATAIVSAQSQEVTQLQGWQQQWGYVPAEGAAMDHSAMAMHDDMADMTAGLKGKTGADFDKAFLAVMIEHHESAIAMAKPAATNAAHDEIKQLAAAVVTAQTDEIARMRSWQQQWGFAAQP